MRPYLAVIKDSFREAFATRVLWIMLALITLVLIALVGFGFEESVQIRLGHTAIREPALFLQQLRDAGEFQATANSHNGDAQPAASQAIQSVRAAVWNALSKELQADVKKMKPDGDRRERMKTLAQIRVQVNAVIRNADFISAESLKSASTRKEARELLEIDASQRSEQQIGRLNRLAIDAAFADSLAPSGGKAVQFVYFGNALGDPLPVSDAQVQEIVSTMLATIVSRLIGNIGVFVAILVTASVIPQMLDAGAIDLLLSKPVNRSFLFLSKFFGGCCFILLNATFMIAGLWLIAGLRFDLWSPGLLLTIPVFVFVFAVYYSVSALAAVIWRNPVVSIVVSIMFWAACFTVGVVKELSDVMALNPRRTAVIMANADESPLITNNSGVAFEWSTEDKGWRQLFNQQQRGPGMQYPLLGPIRIPESNQLLAIKMPPPHRFFGGSANLVIASEEKDWKVRQSIAVPSSSKVLDRTAAGIPIVAALNGIHEIHGDLSKEPKGMKIFGIGLPSADGPRLVRVDSTNRAAWHEPFSAAYDRTNDQFAILAGNEMHVLARKKGQPFEIVTSANRETSEPGLIAIANGRICVAERDGTLRSFNTNSLAEIVTTKPNGTNEPKALQLSEDGLHAALMFHNRDFSFVDAKTHSSAGPINGASDVSAATLTQDSVFLADRFGRVIRYDRQEGLKEIKRWEPKPDFLEGLYSSLIQPLHTVFPKPGDMENLCTWLMTHKDTAAINHEVQDLRSQRVILDVWQPLWSNLAFMGIVLGLTCVLISRADF